MTQARLVLGSWRLRHGEPAAAGEPLRLLPLGEVDVDTQSLILQSKGTPTRDTLPLAVQLGQDEASPIGFLIQGIDLGRCHFVRIPETEPDPAPLPARLQSLFERHHLRLNNNECDYRRLGEAGEATLALGNAASPWQLGWQLHAAFQARQGFAAQFRVAPRAINADIEAHAFTTAQDDGATHLLLAHRGRQREHWDDGLTTLRRLRLDRDGAVPCGGETEGAAPPGCTPAAAWRQLGLEIPLECTRTGHVFLIVVEALRPSTPLGAGLDLVRILYQRSRGGADPGTIPARQAALRHEVGGWLEARQVETRPCQGWLAHMLGAEEAR